MSVHPPGFAERIFEFAYNAEFASKHHSVLAGAPSIPTQNAEAHLGYDIEFAIKSAGGALRYLALQHKVSRFVDGVSPSNSHFVAAAGSPYYAFGIDAGQFNLIEEVASSAPPYVDFYYCAPLFHGLAAINSNYLANTVEQNSVWIDVAGVGRISEHESHTMIYAPSSADAFVFSQEPRSTRLIRDVSEELREIEPGARTLSIEEVYEWLLRSLLALYQGRSGLSGEERRRYSTRLREIDRFSDGPTSRGALSALAHLVVHHLGCSLFVQTIHPQD